MAHAATKRALVAKQRPAGWTPPGMFRQPETLTEAEVVEAEMELKALQRHALEWGIPKQNLRNDTRPISHGCCRLWVLSFRSFHELIERLPG